MPQSTGTFVLDTLNEDLVVDVGGDGSGSFDITTDGAWDGALTFAVSQDNVAWVATSFLNANTFVPAQTYSTASTHVIYTLGVGAYKFMRVRVTTYVAGTASVFATTNYPVTHVALSAGIPAGTNLLGTVAGQSAQDAAVALNPFTVAVEAVTPGNTTPETRVSADGDTATIAGTRDAQVYVLPSGPQHWDYEARFTTAQTDTEVVAAPGAGLSVYLTDIYANIEGAVTVTLEEDGSVWKWAYTGTASGSGADVAKLSPIKLTANKNLTVTTSAAVTVNFNASGFIGP